MVLLAGWCYWLDGIIGQCYQEDSGINRMVFTIPLLSVHLITMECERIREVTKQMR